MSEKYVLTVEFGVWNAYYNHKYLAEFDFTGSYEITGGKLIAANQYFLNIRDAFKTKVHASSVPIGRLKNQLAGIRLEIEGSSETRVDVRTVTGDVSFTIGELQDKGHIEKYCGPHYSMAAIHVEMEGTEWHIPAPREGEIVLDHESFGREQISAHFVRGFVVNGDGGCVTAGLTIPSCSLRLHFVMRFLIGDATDINMIARGTPRFRVLLNGRTIYANVIHTTHHDQALQFLEEVSFTADSSTSIDCSSAAGLNELTIINEDERFNLLVPYIRVTVSEILPLQVTAAPAYAVVGEVFAVTIEINEPAGRVEISYDDDELESTVVGSALETYPLKKDCGQLMNIDPYVNEDKERVLPQGKHDFYFEPKKAGRNIKIVFTDTWSGTRAEAVIPEVWEAGREKIKPLAGAELKTSSMPEMKNFITKVRDTQIANLIVFRDYHNDGGDLSTLWDAAAFCRKNSLHTDTIVMNRQSTVAHASGDMNLAVGTHEHTGIFYGRDKILNTSKDLREAQKAAVSSLAEVCESYRLPGSKTAVGDASGGSRFAYMAGFDIIRHETFVGHHSLILPNARGCARAFLKDVWGCHIASMHNVQPELSGGLRRFWLGVQLSYIMGANFLYEEDSLYQNYKYHKMVNGDFLTAGKQKITRDYLKYIRTQTRQGETDVRTAVLQGRYAPPFNGISTANNYLLDGSAEPACEDYPVFAHTGRIAPCWGYRQPEKGYHLLEVFAPRLFLTPLNQDPRETRKFFAGSPKGEFDLLPAEAPADVYGMYKVIFLLSWHTMEQAYSDYEKMLGYAKAGGTLFLGVPHLTTRADRELLEDMSDLRPVFDGHVESLCGVQIKGISEHSYAGVHRGHGNFGKIDSVPYSSIRLPNSSPDEDGKCRLADLELCGAEILISVGKENIPLLIRNKVGQGYVYLLCTYAFPGHEALKEICYRIVSRITDIHTASDVKISCDRPDDLYYSIRNIDDTHKTIYVLNTDWVEKENRIGFSCGYNGIRYDTYAQEGKLGMLHLFECGIIEFHCDSDIAVTCETERNAYRVCCFDEVRFTIISSADLEIAADGATFRVSKGERTEIAFRADRPVCALEIRF